MAFHYHPVTATPIPKGVIVLWTGTIASIPSGWHLCDGTNGTVDMSDYVPIGYRASGGDPPGTPMPGLAPGDIMYAGISSLVVAAGDTFTDVFPTGQYGTQIASGQTDPFSPQMQSVIVAFIQKL